MSGKKTAFSVKWSDNDGQHFGDPDFL